MSKDPNGSLMRPGDQSYMSEEDLLRGQGYDPHSGHISDTAATLDRGPNGRTLGAPNEYESYDEIQKQVIHWQCL